MVRVQPILVPIYPRVIDVMLILPRSPDDTMLFITV